MDDLLNQVHHADIFDLCARLPDQSVDMILCDLPYGVTACEWDVRIPMEPMWTAFKRVIKPRGAIVLTGTEPFASELRISNTDYRYDWVWYKSLPMGYLNANRNPLKIHEVIVVFFKMLGTYNPQMGKGNPYRATSRSAGGVIRDKTVAGHTTNNYGERYPTSILRINSVQITAHPTQKPVALFEYLIRTYTQTGEIVFDPCVGSGTTAIAARNCGRQFIVGDMLEEYVQVARERLAKPYTVPMFDTPDPAPMPEQLDLFTGGA